MKINWKLRLKNKATLTALLAVLVGAVYSICSVLGITPTIERSELEAVGIALLNLLVLLGVIVDPTTEGVSDSPRAMHYAEPSGVGYEDEDCADLPVS